MWYTAFLNKSKNGARYWLLETRTDPDNVLILWGAGCMSRNSLGWESQITPCDSKMYCDILGSHWRTRRIDSLGLARGLKTSVSIIPCRAANEKLTERCIRTSSILWMWCVNCVWSVWPASQRAFWICNQPSWRNSTLYCKPEQNSSAVRVVRLEPNIDIKSSENKLYETTIGHTYGSWLDYLNGEDFEWLSVVSYPCKKDNYLRYNCWFEGLNARMIPKNYALPFLEMRCWEY